MLKYLKEKMAGEKQEFFCVGFFFKSKQVEFLEMKNTWNFMTLWVGALAHQALQNKIMNLQKQQ